MRRVGFIGLAVFAIWPLATAYTAATLYVDLNSTNPTSPFATWETAATNIQAAVDIAVDGDTVLVTNGVYPPGAGVYRFGETNAISITNGITLRSVNGAASTIIDGGGVMRCVHVFHTNALLDGFTLVNGYSPGASGVNLWYGTVDHCVIVSNKAFAANSVGGGVGMFEGARLFNSTVAWNLCTNGPGSGGLGGGVYCDAGGDVTNCSIVFNTAYTYGGGLWGRWNSPGIPSLFDSCYVAGNRVLATNLAFVNGGGGMYCQGVMVRNCTIVNNMSGKDGGGIMLNGSNTVTNCTVEKNQAIRNGGGIAGGVAIGSSTIANTLINANSAIAFGGGGSDANGNQLTVIGCTISSNTAGNAGGLSIPYVYSCSIFANTATGSVGGVAAYHIRNCTISNNMAGLDCGGVEFYYSMSNCVVIGNTAGGNGGGVLQFGAGDCANSLIVGNTSAVGGGVWGVYAGTLLQNCTISGNHSVTGGGMFGISANQVRNSIIFGNTALDGSNIVAAVTNITYSCVAPLVSGTGNVDVDPTFAGISAGDYRLSWGSACIDSGAADTSTDLDGFARPLDGDGDTVAEYDMGAYEFGFDHSLADADGDAMNDSDEIGAGTNPTNPASVFAMENTAGDAAGWVVTWSSVSNKLYDLYHSTNLLVGFVRIATNVPATAPQNVFTDLTAAADANYYQVRVTR